MTRDEIVREIRRRCRLFGVTFDLREGARVEASPGVRCAGFFDSTDPRGPRLALASKMNVDHFIGTLLHEYCHVTQWAENCTVWQEDAFWSKQCNIHEWLGSGKPCTTLVKKAFEASRDLEADNERRTVRLIKELKPSINLEDYIQRANSYVHFYNTMPITNEWYHPDRVPYKMPNVTKLFRSDKVDDDFSKTPKRQMIALMKCANTRL